MDPTRSIESDLKVRYSNRYYYSMDIWKGKIFLLYYEPDNSRVTPENIVQDQKFMPKVFLHVYDMNDSRQYSCELPQHISPYCKIVVNQKGEFYLLGNTKLYEDIKVYKFRIK
jgi:hypothetical protein